MLQDMPPVNLQQTFNLLRLYMSFHLLYQVSCLTLRENFGHASIKILFDLRFRNCDLGERHVGVAGGVSHLFAQVEEGHLS